MAESVSEAISDMPKHVIIMKNDTSTWKDAIYSRAETQRCTEADTACLVDVGRHCVYMYKQMSIWLY